MSDALLALIPDYGLWLVGVVVALGCLGIPLPASLLVMASGSFAASEDLVLWQVVSTAFGAFALGDQSAFLLARNKGDRLFSRIKTRASAAKALTRAEVLLEKWGIAAVLISHTFLSPLGPYIAYLSGMAKLSWLRFTLAALLGAAFWSLFYALIGFVFASQLGQMAALISNMIGFLMALAALIGLGLWLRRAWRKQQAKEALANRP